MRVVSSLATMRLTCLLSVVIAGPSFAAQGMIRTIDLPAATAPAARVLNLAKGLVEELPAGGARTKQERLVAFRKLGDIAFVVFNEESAFSIISGRCVVLKRDRLAALAGRIPSEVTEDRDQVVGVKQGEYLLVKRMDGGHAILLVKTFNPDKGVTLSWVLNSGGDAPFGQEEIAAIFEAGQPRRAAVQTGVATIRSLISPEPTVFTFEDGKAKPFPHSKRNIRPTGSELRQYYALVTDSADIAYEAVEGAAKVTFVPSRRSKILGRGTLADFADRDISSDLDRSKNGALQGEDLTPGTIVAVQTRGGKIGLIRIESAGTNELKFQWAYLPDGSSVFPKVVPLPDAAPTTPEAARDIKAEAQAGLKGLVYHSAKMPDQDVRTAINRLLSDGADVNMPLDASGAMPLGRAAWIGSRCLVELLMEAGAKIDESEALHGAAYAGRSDVCRLLIEKGANRSYRNRQGLTAFEVAKGCDRSNPEVLAICQPDGDEKLTVHDAAMLGKIDILKRVIAQGADVNGYDSQGKTPLLYAAEAGQAQACEVLIAAGAVAEKGTQYKNVLPMNLAARAGQKDVIRLLMKHASKKQIVDALFQSLVDRRQDIAEVITQDTPDVPGLYRDAPDQIDALLRGGNTSLYSLLKGKAVPLPLWAAAVFGDTNVIAKAIQTGLEIDKPGTDYWAETPLQGAVRSHQYDAARLLLAAGANPNRASPRRGGDTPLHDAARDRDDQMVALLLQHKADFNAAEEAGRTPLVVAVEMHALPVARRLIEAGADAKSVQTSKLDPDDDKELIGLLRKHGAK